MYYDLASRRASVRGARTTLTEGATWYVQGNVTSEEEGVRVYATESTFTSDDREEPAYYFRAERIKVIKGRVLVGRPAYCTFATCPSSCCPSSCRTWRRGGAAGS